MSQDLYDYNKILARYDQNLEKWQISPENKKTIIKFFTRNPSKYLNLVTYLLLYRG
ncbi:hypothetical protein HYU06_01725 [Candidatus Woesearchaeota archaeon]|nr:hypothetical protein [Candidatus Woesearchaeota archaeon]